MREADPSALTIDTHLDEDAGGEHKRIWSKGLTFVKARAPDQREERLRTRRAKGEVEATNAEA